MAFFILSYKLYNPIDLYDARANPDKIEIFPKICYTNYFKTFKNLINFLNKLFLMIIKYSKLLPYLLIRLIIAKG